MPQEIHLHLDLRMTPRFLVGGITAFLVLAFAGELNSEYVNLTTYYPAPSGVYTQMMTTGKAFFAQNANSGVAIGWGSTNFPAGAGLKLSVAGSVAVGSTNNMGMLNPGVGAGTGNLFVDGGIGVGTTNTAGNGIMVKGRFRIGDGNSAAGTSGRSYLYIDNSESSLACDDWPNGTAFTPGTGTTSSSICAGGKYATMTPGVYVEGWVFNNRGGQVVASWGPNPLDFTSKVMTMNPNTGNSTWGELNKIDKNFKVHCCLK